MPLVIGAPEGWDSRTPKTGHVPRESAGGRLTLLIAFGPRTLLSPSLPDRRVRGGPDEAGNGICELADERRHPLSNRLCPFAHELHPPYGWSRSSGDCRRREYHLLVAGKVMVLTESGPENPACPNPM